jgi:hypothetical protein
MNIQRYTLRGSPKANDKGQWIRFSEHAKAIKALTAKPLPPLPPQHDMTDSIDVDQGSEP